MGTQGNSQHSYTLDVDNVLHDGASVTTTEVGEVGAVDKELDFGSLSPGTLVENIAYTRGDMIVDIRSFDFTTGDEFIQVVFQLSDVFATGSIFNKAMVSVGVAGGLVNSLADDDSAVQRRVVGVDNEFDGVLYRYARVIMVTGGTTPICSPFIWFAEKK